MRVRRPAAFGLGLGAAILVAAAVVGGYFGVVRLSQHAVRETAAPTETPSSPPPPSQASSSAQPGEPDQTKRQLLAWQASSIPADQLKGPILDAAITFFAGHTGVDQAKLRRQVVTLSPSDYTGKSVSNCDDAASVRPATEAWLLDIRGDTLFVNDGFAATTKQSAIDLFFRYTIGLYTIAPALKSYPNGVKSSDGTTAYYEKGLILLGRRTVDQLLGTSCYLQYRLPLEEAFTPDRALSLVGQLGLAPDRDYAYPQKASLGAYRAKIAPRIASATSELLDPFLRTDSGEFYRRVGRALGSDAPGSGAAADTLFRTVFPSS